jgi:adenine-specific DNA-methyltransferase
MISAMRDIDAGFDKAFVEAQHLVRHFEANKSHYCSPAYIEHATRSDFINRLLIALGWDVLHERQRNPYAQEVHQERNIGVAGAKKKADYAFYIAPSFRDADVRFYLEAKKPGIKLGTADSYFQTIRYGWNGGVPVSVLTNFEELHVIDCRYEPDIDTALQHQLARFHYREYLDRDRFAEIYYLLSRDAVAAGSLVHYVANLAPVRPAARYGLPRPLDDSLLARLDQLRLDLAKLFKHGQRTLPAETLTEITQRAIDRLIFIRFIEDKLIEPREILSRISGWKDFVQHCQRLNGVYNGIVFRRHDILDDAAFRVDDTDFIASWEDLSQHNSQYNFNQIPIHILGSIYERFLGSVIVPSGRGVRVEVKRDLQKIGGIYYTPEYVVRYIVDKSVGQLIAGKTPTQVSRMTFADIACGSGSFLLGVYDLLLRHHTRYYNDNPTSARSGDWVEVDGIRHLSLKKKREILVNTIYGVDIDPQAVEVAQLSLYLKLLEEETTGSARNAQLEIGEALLPSLGRNIVCGNSLIGTEALDGRFNADTEKRLRPMDFSKAFPKVIEKGGFDAIVGNPPYRRELQFKALMDEIAGTRLGRRFRAARMDLWYYFVHRGLELLSPKGTLSFIVNAYWTAGAGAEKLIADIRQNAHIDEVFSLGKLRVFRNVSGQHLIFRLSKPATAKPTLIRLARSSTSRDSAEPFVVGHEDTLEFQKGPKELFRDARIDLEPIQGNLLAKISKWSPLLDLGIVRQGIAENPASINQKVNKRFGNRWRVGDGVFTLTHAQLTSLHLSRSELRILRPYHDLSDLGRYFIADHPSLHLIYSTRETWPNLSDFPELRQHLERFRPIMEQRRETMNGSNRWWHLHWPRDEAIWNSEKIIAVQMARRPSFAVATSPAYVTFSVNVFVATPETREDLRYVTAILNSKVLWKWFIHAAKRRGVSLEINGGVLQRAPIRRIDFKDKTEQRVHDELATWADEMQRLRREQHSSRSERDKDYFDRKIEKLDAAIDAEVYQLYGLTDSEVAALEASVLQLTNSS